MIIVPIGIDCSLADILKKYNLRKYSLPFDWILTYKDISEIFKQDFVDFFPQKRIGYHGGPFKLLSAFNKYECKFIHEDFKYKMQKEKEKYDRRIKRLKELLQNTEETIYFIRRSHQFVHHTEYYFKNDLDIVIDLYKYMKETYKEMKIKMVLILSCSNCFANIKNLSILNDIYVFNSHKYNDDFDVYFEKEIIPLLK